MSQLTVGQFRVMVDVRVKEGGGFVREKRQAGKDGKDSNNLKTIVFVYSFAAFKVVRAYKYLLILYVYACAFKRARGKGLEKFMNYIK